MFFFVLVFSKMFGGLYATLSADTQTSESEVVMHIDLTSALVYPQLLPRIYTDICFESLDGIYGKHKDIMVQELYGELHVFLITCKINIENMTELSESLSAIQARDFVDKTGGTVHHLAQNQGLDDWENEASQKTNPNISNTCSAWYKKRNKEETEKKYDTKDDVFYAALAKDIKAFRKIKEETSIKNNTKSSTQSIGEVDELLEFERLFEVQLKTKGCSIERLELGLSPEAVKLLKNMQLTITYIQEFFTKHKNYFSQNLEFRENVWDIQAGDLVCQRGGVIHEIKSLMETFEEEVKEVIETNEMLISYALNKTAPQPANVLKIKLETVTKKLRTVTINIQNIVCEIMSNIASHNRGSNLAYRGQTQQKETNAGEVKGPKLYTTTTKSEIEKRNKESQSENDQKWEILGTKGDVLTPDFTAAHQETESLEPKMNLQEENNANEEIEHLKLDQIAQTGVNRPNIVQKIFEELKTIGDQLETEDSSSYAESLAKEPSERWAGTDWGGADLNLSQNQNNDSMERLRGILVNDVAPPCFYLLGCTKWKRSSRHCNIHCLKYDMMQIEEYRKKEYMSGTRSIHKKGNFRSVVTAIILGLSALGNLFSGVWR